MRLRSPFRLGGRSRIDRARRAADRFIHSWPAEATILTLIPASVVVLFLEMAQPQGSVAFEWYASIGNTITWIFVVELSIRFWVAVKKRRFFSRYWIDILSCLPLLGPLRFLRVLRLLRIFRAGALFNRRLSVFQGAFLGTVNELTMLGTLTLTVILASGIVLYVFEGGASGSFPGLDEAMWFSVYSLIGGEPIGGSPAAMGLPGRVTTLVLMFGGLTLFGMFIGTVSASMVSRLSSLEVTEMDLDELSGHRVVCGWNHAGPGVMLEMFSPGNPRGKEPVVLITETQGLPDDVPVDGVRHDLLYHVSGDHTRVETLHRAGILRATSATLLADTVVQRSDQDRDARTVLSALTIEKLSPEIFTVAELTNRENESLLRMHGVEEIVVADEYSAVILGSAVRNRGLVAVLDEILTSRHGNTFHKVEVDRSWIGWDIGRLMPELKEKHDALLVGVERAEADGHNGIVVNPPVSFQVGEGDVLLLISSGSTGRKS